MDPDLTSGPDPVYQVFTDLGEHFWINKTVVAPGKLGQEFTKTFGHYHGVLVDEKYFVAEGTGVLVLENEKEVFLVKAGVGDEVVIKPEYGHSWSNVGKGDLVLLDNWSIPHSPTDYAQIKRLHGMAYYLVEESGEIKSVANSNYKSPPSPIWLTAEEFRNRLNGRE